MASQGQKVEKYGATDTGEPAKHDDHHGDEHHQEDHPLVHHHHRDHDPKGYPDEHSVWSELPTWVLLVIQYLVGLGVAFSIAGVVSVFWPVAAIYFYKYLDHHKTFQHLLALIVFLVALVVSPIVYLVLSLVALVLWVIWLVEDIRAVSGDKPRPKITSPYFSGLFTYAN